MLGMSDMLADMLKKAIPPEVAAMLTEEKVKEIGEKANAFITDIRQSLDFIKSQNATTHDLLQSLLEHTSDNHTAQLNAITEGLANVGSNSNQRPARKRAGNSDGSDSADN